MDFYSVARSFMISRTRPNEQWLQQTIDSQMIVDERKHHDSFKVKTVVGCCLQLGAT